MIRIQRLTVSAYEFPTASHEADGTLDWDSTTLVVVELEAGGQSGLGYSYASGAAARVVEETLAPVLLGQDPDGVRRLWKDMFRAVRNLGQSGLAACAISAADVALWDLKARLLELPLSRLLDATREQIPLYGSGGFTNYTPGQLEGQLAGWVETGLTAVKIKVGRQPEQDVRRVAQARKVIGPSTRLMVDANGALSRSQTQALAWQFKEHGVSYFEEPLPAERCDELSALRSLMPPGMEIALGEYAYRPEQFLQLLQARAVDVLQADATRCGGVSGFLQADALAEAFGMPLSAHCAPNLHAQVGCACLALREVEYFFDHVRLEEHFFEGSRQPEGGCLRPPDGPGLGLRLKREQARKYQIYGAKRELDESTR